MLEDVTSSCDTLVAADRGSMREVIVELHCKASCLEEFAKDFIGVFFSDLDAQLLI